MDIKTAKSIPIDELLLKLGCDVAKVMSGCKWYRSPMRNEKTPSFKLTRDARGWYDWGTGEHGNILDLAYRLHSGLTLPANLDGEQVKEALAYIESVVGSNVTHSLPVISQPLPPKEPAYMILEAKQFDMYGRGSSLSKASLYLGTRGIDVRQFAPYLEDIVYTGEDGKKRYGFGMPNVSDGKELRRFGDWAKIAVGPKDVTIFKAAREASPWHCFYSMMDFGTFLTVDKPPIGAYHYLIINSDSLVDKAISYLESMPAGHMVHYPHMDESGQNAYRKMLDFLVSNEWGGGDRAHLYDGFKDWTEAREQQIGLSSKVAKPVVGVKATPKIGFR